MLPNFISFILLLEFYKNKLLFSSSVFVEKSDILPLAILLSVICNHKDNSRKTFSGQRWIYLSLWGFTLVLTAFVNNPLEIHVYHLVMSNDAGSHGYVLQLLESRC